MNKGISNKDLQEFFENYLEDDQHNVKYGKIKLI